MKVASWNVNSVRARQERLLGWLQASAPDVVCLQELKCTDDEFPALELQAAGYQSACLGQKTYNGVAILAKHPIEDVRRGFDDGVDDTQARFLSARVNGVRILCIYAPNGQSVDSPAFLYKLAWYERLRKYLDTHHRPDEPLLLCGDFNVAPQPIDVHDPAAWEGQTLFTLREREALERVREFGLTDTFRAKNPDAVKYSWWDYRMLAFPKNRGLRIDYLLVTPPLVKRLVGSDIDREARKGKTPSDHAPVWAEFSE